MPLNFSDTLATGEGSFFNLVDLTQNRVKGIGYYSALEEVFDQPVDQRTLGFVALVSGANETAAYIYSNPSLDGWQTANNWTLLGNDTPQITSPSIYEDIVSGQVALVGSHELAAGGVPTGFYDDEGFFVSSLFWAIDHDLLNAMVLDGADTNPYEPRDTKFGNTASYFLGEDVTFDNCAIRVDAFWGYQHYVELSSDPGLGFPGFSEPQLTKIEAATWASTGGDSDDAAIRDYLLTIPGSIRDQTYMVYMPPASGAAGGYLAKLPSITSDADMVNSSNWSYLSPSALQFYVIRRYGANNSISASRRYGIYPNTIANTVNWTNVELLTSDGTPESGVQNAAAIKELSLGVYMSTDLYNVLSANPDVWKYHPLRYTVQLTAKQ